MLLSGLWMVGCIEAGLFEKTDCTKHDALGKMSWGGCSNTSGRSMNSSGMPSSEDRALEASDTVTAAEDDTVDEPWFFIGHSFRQ